MVDGQTKMKFHPILIVWFLSDNWILLLSFSNVEKEKGMTFFFFFYVCSCFEYDMFPLVSCPIFLVHFKFIL